MDFSDRCCTAAHTVAGPSSSSDSATNGSGATTLDHTMKANWFMGPCRPTARVTRLPQPHIAAAATVSAKPASGIEAPCALPISTSPTPASAKPATWLPCHCSRSSTTASSSVKNDCDCSTSDAKPEGMPMWMAVNSSANWATAIVMPYSRYRRKGTLGGLTNSSAGNAAKR